jgi:predicted lipase
MPRKIFNLKDDDGKGKGRTYDHSYSEMPGGINIEEVTLGMKLASLAITDDEPGTLETVGKLNPWHIQALGMITGTVEQAHKPLREILSETLGYTLARNISAKSVSIAGHFVDVQGYIAHNEQDLVLAYRCTTSAFDWLTNFNAGTSEFEPEEDVAAGDSGCCSFWEGRFSTRKPRVHTGFYNNFLASAQDIEELIEPHLKPDAPPRRIFIVGHSLGAGVATVAFMYLLFKFDWSTLPHKLLLVTAGGPRVVDSRLHDKVQDEMRRLRPLDKAVICRVVNRNDVVPTLPPEAMGFRHLDKLVYITDEEKVLINPNLDEQEVVEEQKDKAALKDQVNKVNGVAAAASEQMASAAAAAHQVFVENYDKVLGQIPSQFKDHMPDLYLGPLEHLFEDVAYTGKDGVEEIVAI